jgi:hypothetical protein
MSFRKLGVQLPLGALVFADFTAPITSVTKNLTIDLLSAY